MTEKEKFDEWFKPRKMAMQKRGISTVKIVKLYQRQREAWLAALKLAVESEES